MPASLGIGATFLLSESDWRLRIRQAWLSGFLHRSMQLGHSNRRLTSMVFNTYSTTEAGRELITSPAPILLPGIHTPAAHSTTRTSSTDITSPKKTRKSKGAHLLPTLCNLLSSRENWFEIKKPEDYQFPGKFSAAYPQRLGFSPDITRLPFYGENDEHFLFTDIQASYELRGK